jgi:hypothetical protein
MISKYQFMEVNTQRRGTGLREKIPDIKKTLEMVRFLKLRKEVCNPRPEERGRRIMIMEIEGTISDFFFFLLAVQPQCRPRDQLRTQ